MTSIYEVSGSENTTARRILELREKLQELISERMAGNAMGFRLVNYLFEHPLTNIQLVAGGMNCAYVTASKLVAKFAELGILSEMTGQRRNRRYLFAPYMMIFAEISAPPGETEEKVSRKARKAPVEKAK